MNQYKLKIFFYRESAAIYISKYLLDEGAYLYIYDPQVEEEQIMLEMSNPQFNYTFDTLKQKINICHDPYEACDKSHAIVICTEWDEFKVDINESKINWEKRH